MLSHATTITLKEYYAYLNNDEAQIAYPGLTDNDITSENFVDLANNISKYISERKSHERTFLFLCRGPLSGPPHCISYLYYLILARPDLYVAHSLLIDKAGVTFFAGLTGKGIFRVNLPYKDENLRPLLCALINHIYDPGKFKDNTYEVTYTKNIGFRYTISLNTVSGDTKCSNLEAIYARNPFETTTFIYAITDDNSPPVYVNNERLRVINDQYCRRTRFNEPQILEKIRDTPGVVTMVHNEVLQLPVNPEYRMKRRLGFSQFGHPLMNVETVREMLEVLYDTLEVTRYLRLEKSVLHRDLSIGNIVVDKNVDKNAKSTVPMPETNVASQNDDGEQICFIKHLLGESNDPLETSAVLIDFNRAESMDTTTLHPQGDRTGTPLFIARAVQNNGPYPDLSNVRLTDFPELPKAPTTYQACHAERVKKFPENKDYILFGKDAVLAERIWRHELYHDAESIFWIFLYWLMLANSEPGDTSGSETVNTARWELFVEPKVNGRSGALNMIINQGVEEFVHSKLYPISDLVTDLAGATYPGPYYLPDSDPRTRPDYLHEFFQRAILNFIMDNKEAEFMDLKMNISHPRKVVMTKTRNTPSQTSAHLTTGDSSRTGSKRASPNPSEGEQDTLGEGPSKKSRRKGPEAPQPSEPSAFSQSSTQAPASS